MPDGQGVRHAISAFRHGSAWVLVVAALTVVGCSRAENVGEAGVSGTASGNGAPHEAPPAGDSLASLFDLAIALTDQEGRARRLSDFRGRPLVASMLYTRCTTVCPHVIADLQALERSLTPADRAGLRFLLFSLDPERDTPLALRDFAARHDLDRERWTLLATGAEDLDTLAAVLGVPYGPDGGGEIAHSALIALVDAEGVVRRRQLGTGNDPGPLRAAVRELRRAP